MKKYLFILVCYYFVPVYVAQTETFKDRITVGNKTSESYINRYGNIVTILSDSLTLTCTQNLNMNFDKFNRTLYVNTVTIIWCLPTNNSYGEILNSYNINVAVLKNLHLNFKNVPLELSKLHFSNLEIEELHLDNDGFPMNIQFLDDFIEPLNKMKSLVVDKIVFPPLPEHTNVRKVILRNGISQDDFGGCQHMEELQLIYWEIPRPRFRNWLTNCSHLLILKLDRISPTAVSVALGSDQIQNIQNLTMTRCDLTEIPFKLLTNATALRHLDLSHNFLNSLSYDQSVWLQSLKNLESLDLSHNELSYDGYTVLWVAEVSSTTHKMKDLSIAHNNLVWRPGDCEEDGISTFSITRLTYAFTNLLKICFKQYVINNLEYLDLTNNNISMVKFDQLPNSDSQYIADLRKNPLHTIVFGQQDYEKLLIQNSTTKVNVTIRMDSTLDCDCNHAWYARALREKILFAINAICNDQTQVMIKPKDTLECVKTENKDCIFRESWDDGTVVATCNNTSIDVLPAGRRFKIIHAADNEIEMIRLEDLPSTLQFLDLQRNSISRVDEVVARALFDHSRHVLLRGNPILCNCNNKYFIEQLQKHRSQVDDYVNLTCAGEELALREVNSNDLCSILPLVPMVSGGTLFSLVLLAYIIYRMYGRDIKMFLFTHGWCLCCVREEDLDADRDYDAFISFSHQDFRIVNECLMPKLEPDYRICLHYRDWVVGEWIPAQIQTSILSSKRTILILSRNYLESVWGMFEFRMSFAWALKEGRMRIIIIVLDDVTSVEMAPDLSNFVSNNTYLKWEDPWFWRKLRYALPHKVGGNKNTQSNGDDATAGGRSNSIVLSVSYNVSEPVINHTEITI